MPFLYSVLYAALIGTLSHYIGEALPRSLFSPSRALFSCKKWEKNGKIYEKLGVRTWKDKLPDMSKIMKDMLPKKVPIGAKSEQVELLIRETCVAETVHLALCLLSPPIYFFWKNSVGLILTAVYVVCNIPFMIIQRYNRPQLVRLCKRLRAREERRARIENTDTVV